MTVLGRAVKLMVAGALALAVAGCGVVIEGSPSPGDGVIVGDVDTSILRGTDNGPVDRLAAATVIDVQSYWHDTFEPTFDKPWQDVKAFYSVDTTDDSAKPPPCTESAADVSGNAFYCAAADSIAFDRAALLPVLVENYGEAGVVVVLAHEIGHAVHNRLGIDVAAQRSSPQLYPTIVVESMADCYAGAFLHWVTDGKAPHLKVDTDQLDAALGSLVSFRDPVGTSSADRGAHGNAFDRVSSFQDGFREGPELCSKITGQNRPFTLREFTNLDDQQRNGNLPLSDLVEQITGDLDTFFAAVVRAKGGTWEDPEVDADPHCSGDQGPAAFCPAAGSGNGGNGGVGTIGVDKSDPDLARLHEIGDYATGTLLASRFGLAVLAALGKPDEGDTAARAALCLAGAYTGDLLNREEGFGLSPGDLDEAVLLLLRFDYPVRDAKGSPAPGSGFDRVGVFRGGTLDGANSCDLG